MSTKNNAFDELNALLDDIRKEFTERIATLGEILPKIAKTKTRVNRKLVARVNKSKDIAFDDDGELVHPELEEVCSWLENEFSESSLEEGIEDVRSSISEVIGNLRDRLKDLDQLIARFRRGK